MSRRLRRAAAYLPLRAAMIALEPVERRLRSAHHAPAGPPIFVLGPPRSGTTLFYDVLVASHRLSYLATIANRLWRTPGAATTLARRTIRAYAGTFESRHGHIAGWGAPNEGGAVWRSWYDETRPLDETHVATVDADRIRATIGAISRSVGAPFVSKNVMHSMHIRFLDALFPACLFVEVRRDDMDTAKSILRLRMEESGGSMTEWRSIRPPGHERFLNAPPPAQVAAQILLTRETIERDMTRLGGDRRLVVQYEDLCADPMGAMARVRAFVESRGGRLERRECRLPEFSARHGRPLPGVPDDALTGELARVRAMLAPTNEREASS